MLGIKNRQIPKDKQRESLWNAAVKSKFAAVFWRLPNQSQKNFLLSFDTPQPCKVDFEELPSGFVFSPFTNNDNQQALFFKADIHYTFDEKDELEEAISPAEINPNFQKFNSNLAYKEHFSSENDQITVDTQQDAIKKVAFEALVNKGIESIQKGEFQKVVLSRTKAITLPQNFNVVDNFDRLCDKYPSAFISLIYLPETGVIWLGASPEILVSQDANGIFKTMALAGTQSAYDDKGEQIKTSEALWRQKEIEEQALVSRYIINCLKKIRVREFEEDGPKTMVAGNLMHLQTDFLIDTNAINFPQLATVMIELLHPTSAVCGMPKEPATQFILQNEGYDRDFYSGFLGSVNIQNESHIFVNLRTMKIDGSSALLYAGCGITADSSPEKEWQETQIKCLTLANVLK